jgi:hypothetical protein
VRLYWNYEDGTVKATNVQVSGKVLTFKMKLNWFEDDETNFEFEVDPEVADVATLYVEINGEWMPYWSFKCMVRKVIGL